MSTLYIDFETTSTVDLKKVGAWMYSRHPSTDVLCMAYAEEGDEVHITPHKRIPEMTAFEVILRRALKVEAHNAFFERAIWTNIMVARYGWPEIPEDKWRCSAALAASKGLPRKLEYVAQVLKLKNQKDPRGQKLILKTNGIKRKVLDGNEFKDLCDYCKRDVEVERELSQRLGSLSPQELKVWQLDQKINLRGIYFDRKCVESAMGLVGEFANGLKSDVASITKGEITSTNQVAKTIEWLGKKGVKVKDLTKDSVSKALARGDSLDPDAKMVLSIRAQLAKNSVKKLEAMQNVADSDDRIRDCFMYHGASTGRWTGKLVQLQNLPRGTINDLDTCFDLINAGDLELFKACYPDVMGAVSSCVRGMLTAKPGHTLIAADYNAIETRVLFWLAGEERGLQKFRDGTDLYKDMASDIYKVSNDAVTKLQRQVGKTAILGLGYQMGAEKFFDTCALNGIDLSKQLAEGVIITYRSKYDSVVRFWYAMEDNARKAFKNPGKGYKVGRLTWIYDQVQNILGLRLPSGRHLHYWWPSIESVTRMNKDGVEYTKDALCFWSVDSTTKKWAKESTYGGKLVENAVQAVARDLLAEAMLNLNRHEHDIVLHAHDEVVIECAEEHRDVNEHFLTIEMESLPNWAEGLPIKAETWVSKRYKK